MNKYVLRTSMFWLCLFGMGVGLFLYRPAWVKKKNLESGKPQPVAAGPAPTKENMPAASSSQNLEAPLTPVQLTPESMQSIGIKTSVVTWKAISDDIRATGTIDIDERLVSYVQVRFRGYVRKVFANATYQYVRKGEPLFTIYSPDLVATEQDYLNALENEKQLGASAIEGVASEAKDVTAATEVRLRRWDVSQSDVAKLKETRALASDLSVDSPVSGYITERNALPNLYVEPGSRLYTIADLSRVWAYAQVFQDDLGKVRPGDTAAITVDAYPGRRFSGRIESILPQVDMVTRTARVRLEVFNPGVTLKPGMFVNVELKTNLGRQLVVPASAVLPSGTRQLVFVSLGNGRIEPKEVLLGPRAGDDVVIVKGLQAGEQVVTSSNFLIDSESQLQAAAGAYSPPAPAATPATQSAEAAVEFTTTPSTPHKGENVFHLKVSEPGGAAIDGAEVLVTFFMPAMPAMGMAAMNTTVRLGGKGGGVYEGSGVLGSGGTWLVTITVRKNGTTIATKQMHVNAEGGM